MGLFTFISNGVTFNPDTYGVGVESVTGIGMPPIVHNVFNQPSLEGSLYQGTKIQPRVITLVLWAKGSDMIGLHTTRHRLIDMFGVELTPNNDPVTLRYSGAGTTIEIPVRYDGGLDFELQSGQGFQHAIPLRLIAYDPSWRATSSTSVTLDSRDTPLINYIVGRVNGAWPYFKAPNTTATGASIIAQGLGDTGHSMDFIQSAIEVLAIAKHPTTGDLYVGGDFVNWDGLQYGDALVRYDVETHTWHALNNGSFDGPVWALAFDAAGNLYIGGNFTTAGGTAANNVAKWNGSSFSALSTGLGSNLTTDQVYCMAVAPNGDVYAGGNFTTNATRVAKWNGTSWSTLSTGANDYVWNMAVDLSGNLYIVGNFSTVGGVSCANVAKWNGTAFSALGSGTDAITRGVAIRPNGNVIVGGSFNTAGGISCVSIAEWNGIKWSPLGSGISRSGGGTVYDVAIDSEGNVWAGGYLLTLAGSLSLNEALAVWNGSSWNTPDLVLPTTSGLRQINCVVADGTNVYLGHRAAGTNGACGGSTTVRNGHEASAASTGAVHASAYPTITITRSGGTAATIQRISNTTQGTDLNLNYALMSGETLTINLTPGAKAITSNLRGNVLGVALRTGSNLAAFSLVPGDNSIVCYVSTSGSPTVTASMSYTKRYWSVDGAAPL